MLNICKAIASTNEKISAVLRNDVFDGTCSTCRYYSQTFFSVQLTVDAAATQVDRIGNTYSVSGNGVSLDVGGGAGSEDLNIGGLGTLASGVSSSAVIPTAYQTTDGASFSFTNSFTQGDALVTTAPSTGAVSALSSQVSTAAWYWNTYRNNN